ncbi:SIMPL domain-containing protein [Microcystis aeruginosa CS-1036]|uniref:SIMPL domain-containing protein n=1 Tax=Microcystis TaxID=1125 RepID=UPI00232B925A|nr:MULTISPECIES: SIMPL domain-containing protein [Microcystis]MDB9404973.1 SIMPL domain-containing protein [Microcystis sp. CS-574]MDB9543874.1 SIMPL domain-containing protein [Microcystis aeruginosa CS-1036]
MNYKKFCLAFLLSLILINTGLVMPSYANERELRTITVTGEGIENIATSQAIVRLGVEVQGKEAGKVQQETANRSDAVVKFLRSRQVEKLETTGISLQPNYDFSNNQRRLIGYIGANLISFQVDIAQAGILIDEAVKVGATRIDGVSFTAGESAIAAAQRTALIKATEQAREQATIVLQALGLVPKETVSIQVGNTSNPVPIARSEAVFRSADAASSPVIGGEQTLRAAVTLEISY